MITFEIQVKYSVQEQVYTRSKKNPAEHTSSCWV